MKKLMICLIAMTLLSATLCGCNKSGGGDTTGTTVDRSQITTTLPTFETTATVPPPTEPPVVSDEPIEYHSELHPGLQMLLPASWDGKYAVRESDTSIEFYELQNHLFDGSGKLFTLMFMNAADYEDGMFPSYDVVYQSETSYVLALYPTDVQTSDEFFEQYQLMSDEIPNITETVQYAG